jgi:hypothetical protein
MQSLGLAHNNARMSDYASALAPVEYGYFFVIFYTVLGAPLGLILIGGIGSGFLSIPVLALCFVALGPSVLTVLQAAWIPLACGASYLFIQLVVHGLSFYEMYVYQFGPWLLAIFIVQALVMHRPSFLHRFAWFTFFISLATLPFMTIMSGGGHVRMGLDREIGVLANPNALAAWFGFCVLYLTIKGYVETRLPYRLAEWFMALGCLYVVTLTGSRGALIAIVASLLVVSKRLLTVGFLPILMLAVLVLGLIEFGAFDDAIGMYTRRGAEETGRLQVWPLLIEQFVNSPAIGVGASHAGAETSPGIFRTPHNGFLLFAVASGVVPFFLFCAYFVRSGMAALHSNISDQNFLFYLPLVTYSALIASSAGNIEFMAPFAVVSLAAPFASNLTSSESRHSRDTHFGLRLKDVR